MWLNFKKCSKFRNIWNQLFVVLIGNIIVVSQGNSIGWFSAALPILLSNDSPLTYGPISLDEGSWIGSLMSFGSIPGPIIFGLMTQKFGAKYSLLAVTVPTLISWILVAFANSSWPLYFVRILMGICFNGPHVCLTLFVAEISDRKFRGSFITTSAVAMGIGGLVSFLLVTYLDYNTVPIIMVSIPILFLLTFSFVPNTPQYWISRSNIDKAKESLCFYRNFNKSSPVQLLQMEKDLEALKSVKSSTEEKYNLKVSDFFNGPALKGILISMSLMAFMSMSGAFVIITYTAYIYGIADVALGPNTSSIFLYVLNICGYILSALVIDKFGRKSILVISLTGCLIGNVLTGVYSFLKEQQYDVSDYNFIPIFSIAFIPFMSCFGMHTVPYVIMTEIIPLKVKKVGCAIAVLTPNILALILLKIFPILIDQIGLYGWMSIFALFNVLGILFILNFVTETKGKNIDVDD